jgi:methionyl-tRNA formyltransferase
VTIMQVTEGLDAGPVGLQRAIEIASSDGFEAVASRLAALGGSLLNEALDSLERGELEFTEQDESEATYASKISPEERRLDPSRPAIELERQVRALNPHIGTYLELEDGGRLGVRAARALDAGPPQGQISTEGGELRLGCGSGALALDLVQPPGKRPMAAPEFLRGHPAPPPAA